MLAPHDVQYLILLPHLLQYRTIVRPFIPEALRGRQVLFRRRRGLHSPRERRA